MFARVASFEGGDGQGLRAYNEERFSDGTLTPPPGARRALVLEDEPGGRRMFITFFDSREAIAEAEQAFEAMGDQVPQELRGRRVGVDVYEVTWEATT
jgi:hypothetical protein